MIPWTTHFDRLGFKYETTELGSVFICFCLGGFQISYSRYKEPL